MSTSIRWITVVRWIKFVVNHFRHDYLYHSSFTITSGAESKSLPQCHFRGETFGYGQKFYPKTIFAACHQCICDENFDNSTVMEMQEGNKSCKKVNCGLQLRFMDEFKSGCTPIYYKDTKCCPIDFQCRKCAIHLSKL